MAAPNREEEVAPLINSNPELQTYYQSLESRIGYRFVLGGTRHFGYWDNDTWWPFAITSSLRRMEQKMFERFNLPKGASVLDAGCGVAHVALYMARRGLRVTCIDVVEHHVEKAGRNIKRSGLPDGQVSVQRADYHNLEWIPDASFDGIYTMETLVHATDLETVLRGFYRILKPGGQLVEHEYETVNIAPAMEASYFRNGVNLIVEKGALPLDPMREGNLKQTLEDIGFVDVNIRDYSENIRPMLRMFFWMAAIPFFFFKILCLEKYFVNTVAGFGGFLGQDHWRYISISATKPGGPVDLEKTEQPQS